MPKTRLRAVPGTVIVIRDEAKEESEGGIVIPKAGQEPMHVGTVVDHFPGPDSKGRLEAVAWKAGDRLIFNPFADPVGFTHEGKKYHLIRETDVLAELEEVK